MVLNAYLSARTALALRTLLISVNTPVATPNTVSPIMFAYCFAPAQARCALQTPRKAGAAPPACLRWTCILEECTYIHNKHDLG